MAEHSFWERGVAGSSPAISTSFSKGFYMKRMIVALMLLSMLWATPVIAQSPTSVIIRVTELVDTTQIRISWSAVPGATTYDVITFSNPRQFELEQFRVVTGLSWTIRVPSIQMMDSTRFYASVRVSTSPKYASITYRTPLPPQNIISAITALPDSTSLTQGNTQQICAFVVFQDGQVAMRNPEKVLPYCTTQYNTFAPVIRVPTTIQQSIADTVQVMFSSVNLASSMAQISAPIKELWIIKP